MSTYCIKMNVVLYGLIVAVLWGAMNAINKYVLNSIHPQMLFVLGGIVYFASILVFIACNWRLLKTESIRVKPSVLAWIVGGTIACTFGGSILYYYVLSKHDSHVVTAIVSSSPLVTLLLAYLFLKEDITANGLIGVFLIVAGVICIGQNK